MGACEWLAGYACIMTCLKRIDVLLLSARNRPEEKALFETAFQEKKPRIHTAVCTDSLEAFQLLERNCLPPAGILPALLIIDAQEDSVLSFLQKLNAHEVFHLIPVVLALPTCSNDQFVQFSQFGVNSIIERPGDAAAFIADLKTVTQYWLQFNKALR